MRNEVIRTIICVCWRWYTFETRIAGLQSLKFPTLHCPLIYQSKLAQYVLHCRDALALQNYHNNDNKPPPKLILGLLAGFSLGNICACKCMHRLVNAGVQNTTFRT